MNEVAKQETNSKPEMLPPAESVAHYPPLDLPKTPFDEIAKAIAAAAAEIAENPVLKEGKNTFHGYSFARMQDIVEHVSPILSKHGLSITQTERDRGFMDKGNAIFAVYSFVILHKSGQVWPVSPLATGVANTRTSKGTFDDKGLAKCFTAARKSMLISLFNIPTTDDPDYSSRPQRPKGPPPIEQKQHGVPDITKPMPLPPAERDEQWADWSGRLVAIWNACTGIDQVEAWTTANQLPLDEMRKAVPDHHAHVMRIYNKRILALQPAEKD